MESEAKNVLTKLGITNFEEKVGNLSGGQKKRIMLAAALITPCELLILDEPTNHLDNETISWLEEYLNSRKGALLMITHDRYFLDRVSNKILELDEDNLTLTVEPGVLIMEIAKFVEEHDLFYPPDPGEKTASIGGNVITHAGGMKAVRYGLTRDFVRCIEAVMPDGSIMNFSSNVVKNTTGFDVKDLVIGSEGILCILTEVTLKLLPAPTCSSTLVMPFRSLEECADMVPKVLDLFQQRLNFWKEH